MWALCSSTRCRAAAQATEGGPSGCDCAREIVLDYYHMGEESETAEDRKSSAYFSTSLDSKTSQFAVAFVAGAIQELGYKRILMKSDNEPAIKRLKERVSECLPGVECVPRETPVGDSRAIGSAENAVKQVKGQIRHSKLRQKTGTVAKLMRNLVCWLGSRDIVQTS